MKVVCLSLWAFADYTIRLANALSAAGQTVMLLLPKATLPEHIRSVAKGVELQLFRQSEPRVSIYPWRSLPLVWDIVSRINKYKPDVVHVQSTHFWFSLAQMMLWKYPSVTTFHDVKPHLGEERVSTAVINYLIRKHSKKLFVHGQYLKQLMIDMYKVPADKISVIPFAEHYDSPLNEYQTPNVVEDGNLVLFFGRILPYKGLEYLIQAEPLINKEVPEAKIAIAGEGEAFAKYEKMIKNREHFIIHNCYVEPAKAAELFQRCSLVVLPYVEASQSGVITTAYGFKKPVVVTNVGSLPEIVEDGKTGFVVPSRDPAALAGAIVKMLKDKTLRHDMGEKAYQKLKTELSWSVVAKRTISAYQELIQDKA